MADYIPKPVSLDPDPAGGRTGVDAVAWTGQEQVMPGVSAVWKAGNLDPFDEIIREIQLLNRRKRGDYATNDDPWSNFKDSSRQVGQSAGTSVEVLIATKQSRLRQLLFSGREPNNESIRDSLLDRAVYSIIALAMFDEGLYDERTEAA